MPRYQGHSRVSISRAFRASLAGFTSLAAVGLAFMPTAVVAQDSAEASRTVEVSIAEQSMADALKEFARQVGKQIIFYSDDAERLRSGPVNGTFSEREALRRILGNSGLQFIYVNPRTIGIGRRDAEGRFISASAQGGEAQRLSGQPATDTAREGDAIIVTGRLLDAELSIEAKRDADQIIDVITADQASQLPDQNVGETLARIAGVSVIRSNETGDGNYISIRGLDSALSNIQFDGVNTGQVGGARRYTPNRSVPLEGITADNIKEIRVAKSLLPADEGEGIGGSVNIIARTPLDGGRNQFSIEGSGRYSEFADKLGFDGGVNFTKIFSDSFGVNLAASFRRRHIRNYEIGAGTAYLHSIDSVETAAGETLTGADLWDLGLTTQADFQDFTPGHFTADQVIFDSQGYQIQEQMRDTYSASGAVDWRASDTTLFTLSGRYSRTEIDGGEWELGFDQDDTGFELVGNSLVGTFGDLELDYNAQLEDSVDTNASAFFKGVTETDKFLFRYQVSYSHAKTSNPQTDLVFDTDTEFDDADDNLDYMPYRFVDTYFPVPNRSIRDNPAFAAALSDIPSAVMIDPFGLRIFEIELSNKRYMGRTDITYKADTELFGGVLNSITIGGKAERSDVYNFFDYYSFGTAGLNLDGSYSSDGGDAPGSFLSDFTSLNLGSISLDPIGTPLGSVGVNTIPKFGSSEWKRFAGNFRESFLASGDPFIFELFFDGREDVYAGYGQFDFEAGPFKLIAGARFEKYEGTFTAPLNLQGQVTLTAEGEDDRGLQLATPGTQLDSATTEASNTEFLPRLSASYDVSDTFKVRLGAGYSIARPSYNQLGNATTVNISLTAEDPDGGVILPGVTTVAEAVAAGGLSPDELSDVVVSVSSGNPDLENARSLNLDASFEYYPSRGTAVTLGLFYKEIDNFIFLGSESDESSVDIPFVESLLSSEALQLLDSIGGIEALVSDQFDPTLSISRPTNGGTATLKGLEFGVSHRLSWAPGFLRHVGLNGNITYTDSDADFVVDQALDPDEALVLLGYYDAGDTLTRRSTFFRAPEISGNASVYYDDQSFETALSLSYQSESFSSSGDYGLDEFTGAHTQLDLFVGYSIPTGSGEVKLFAEVGDLLDKGNNPSDLKTIGRSRTAFQDASFNGREFRFGVRARF
jgi:TonB-dependent receptor